MKPLAALTAAAALIVPSAAGSADGWASTTASWYGPGFYGNHVACAGWSGFPSSTVLTGSSWGVAHKTLPCGTLLQICRANRCVTAPVFDRGPYVAGRDLDLVVLVRDALGITEQQGIGTVRYRVIR